MIKQLLLSVHQVRQKLNLTWALFLAIAIMITVAVPVSRVFAAGGALAFGYWDESSLKGQRVYVWTASPPNGLPWTAAPVGICKDYWCAQKFVETGWIKGTSWGLNNQLKQYVSYKDTDGITKQVFLSTLNINTWYQFKVMYSQSAGRWEAWQFDNVVWSAPHDLGWTSGTVLAVGGETNTDGDWIGAIGWHPERRPWSGTWTLYNYSSSGTSGSAHIIPAYDYGYHAWGP